MGSFCPVFVSQLCPNLHDWYKQHEEIEKLIISNTILTHLDCGSIHLTFEVNRSILGLPKSCETNFTQDKDFFRFFFKNLMPNF